MRRLLLGLLFGAFLTLVGAQAAHAHDLGPAPDNCAVCAVGQQAVRHAPAQAPVLARADVSVVLRAEAAPRTLAAARADVSSRGPPRAA